MATLNGTILKSDGTAPNPWRDSRRACPLPGPVPVTRAGDIYPKVAHSHIYFWPVGTPYLAAPGSQLISQGDLPLRARISAKDGSFSINLLAGYYRCTVGRNEFSIIIPAGEGPFELQNVITDTAYVPPAVEAGQVGTFIPAVADFVLPANAVNVAGAPVATGWTQTVYGPGTFSISAILNIEATSRGNGAEDNDIFTAYLWDSTNGVQVGAAVTVSNIFTGAQGTLTLMGTITIAPGAPNVLLEIYAAGNPNAGDQTAAPDSVGIILMAQSSITITPL